MIVGIDLGTTNSLVAVWDSGKVTIIPNSIGKLLTPSVISMDNDTILIGEPALNRMVTYPNLTVANFKRYMGSDKLFQLNKHSFRPEELSALILQRLKEDAESFLGCPVTEAVISVPAYFSDAQRKATKIAGKLAGLKVERLINEPTAAGIAYGLQEQDNETNYLIFDLGGGTFDVSIISIFSGIIEVRASSGDNFLGGVDFTHILEEMFINDIKKHPQWNDQIPAALQHKIYEQAELAKHTLSVDSSATLKVNWNQKSLEFSYSDKDFENAAEPLLSRLHDPVKKVLNDANMPPSQIEQIILVGGASRMTAVKRLASRMFGKLALCHLDPDTVVVQGVAIQAGLKSHEKALDEIVVTDVCPYSLGVGVHSERTNQSGCLQFDPIIERNTVIPASRSRTYRPVNDKQKFVEIQVYQGESFFVEKNVFLGKLLLDLPFKLNDPAIDIRFTYDINGLLEVEATIVETKEKKKIIIEGNPGVLSEEEIAEKLDALKDLKIHPRDNTENLLILSLAERLYEDLQGEERIYLGEVIKEFINILNKQDPHLILKSKQTIEKILHDLKSGFHLV